MTSAEFVIWFKGFVAGSNSYNLTPAGWEVVKEQLEKVLDEEKAFQKEEEKKSFPQESVKDPIINWDEAYKKLCPPKEIPNKMQPWDCNPTTPSYPLNPYWWERQHWYKSPYEPPYEVSDFPQPTTIFGSSNGQSGIANLSNCAATTTVTTKKDTPFTYTTK